MENKNLKIKLLLAGGVTGIISTFLVFFGNPKNMGFCIACFIRDTTGALGMHQAAVVQYIRPEIIGLVLGAFLLSLFHKEYLPRGGSSPMIRLTLGFIVMIGALVFLGCPFRMVLRLAGGDLNAFVGLLGFIAGIRAGVFFLEKGYSLKRTYAFSASEGGLFPLLQAFLLILLLVSPAFVLFSEKGPGSMHAPVILSLGAGLIVGGLAQRTRLCMAGGVRDIFLFKDWTLFTGFIAIFIFALIGNLLLNKTTGGYFTLGFLPQPVAHKDGLWNFLSMAMVGWGSVLLGGCPMRQLIMAGEGNTDSAITIMGFVLGAAVSHNFKLASAAQTVKEGVLSGGPTPGGKIAVIAGLAILLILSAANADTINEKFRKGAAV